MRKSIKVVLVAFVLACGLGVWLVSHLPIVLVGKEGGHDDKMCAEEMRQLYVEHIAGVVARVQAVERAEPCEDFLKRVTGRSGLLLHTHCPTTGASFEIVPWRLHANLSSEGLPMQWADEEHIPILLCQRSKEGNGVVLVLFSDGDVVAMTRSATGLITPER